MHNTRTTLATVLDVGYGQLKRTRVASCLCNNHFFLLLFFFWFFFFFFGFPVGSVSASGTGRIRLESRRPAMPDTEPILTGMAPCPALHFSYKFPGSK